MMLELKLAKSMMENEEGMNHLWVRVLREERAEPRKSEIRIRLPNGLYRSPNLNGLVENVRGNIAMDSFDQEVICEIFTQDPVECGDKTIVVTLLSNETTVSEEIRIRVVHEDDMDSVEIDEQVVERIKEISRAPIPPINEATNTIFLQPRVPVIRENKFSYLEKKYRIDYGG
ncbi:hypothetical protein H7B90_28400 [Cohnella xylanilytica]|uniref:Uncharacterized protein n=1 Tax=Cohnella xylanilytica TaxID=557555 RepID=A0A841UAZ7_9BACL|nr:hypothetical protein [Cohnella xylanilytica]MBB6695324.1 hypothetical protein [Cohnella xylanilytica]